MATQFNPSDDEIAEYVAVVERIRARCKGSRTATMAATMVMVGDKLAAKLDELIDANGTSYRHNELMRKLVDMTSDICNQVATSARGR